MVLTLYKKERTRTHTNIQTYMKRFRRETTETTAAPKNSSEFMELRFFSHFSEKNGINFKCEREIHQAWRVAH